MHWTCTNSSSNRLHSTRRIYLAQRLIMTCVGFMWYLVYSYAQFFLFLTYSCINAEWCVWIIHFGLWLVDGFWYEKAPAYESEVGECIQEFIRGIFPPGYEKFAFCAPHILPFDASFACPRLRKQSTLMHKRIQSRKISHRLRKGRVLCTTHFAASELGPPRI